MTSGDMQDDRRRPDRAALAIGVILALVALLMLWDTWRSTAGFSSDPIGPKGFPYLIGVCLLGLAAWTVVAALNGDFPEREHQQLPPMLWIVGGLAAQMLLLNPAGFSIATGLLFAATAYAFGKRKFWKPTSTEFVFVLLARIVAWIVLLLIGILFAFLVWILFAQGLKLALPSGPLERLFFG
jgi:putative tricarboxylic transport membrane protein